MFISDFSLYFFFHGAQTNDRNGEVQFFFAGVSGIRDILRREERDHFYSFIQFEKMAAGDFLSKKFLSDSLAEKTILISCNELLPLALYYMKRTERVVAVFNKHSKVDDIIAELLAPEGELKYRQSKRWRYQSVLTEQEVFLCDLFLTGYSVRQIARMLNLPVRTVYSRINEVKHKMKIRKLHKLALV